MGVLRCSCLGRYAADRNHHLSMARLPRLSVPGLPQLVVQRGHNHQAVFLDEADRLDYLAALREAAAPRDIAVHGYALLHDAAWLLITPATETALSTTMQALGRRYVAAFNRRHGRSGTLWDGRFRAVLVEPALALDPVLRFVETAPVRAGLVQRAQDWPWSSAAHHVGTRRDSLVTTPASYWALGNTPFDREESWRGLLEDGLPVSSCLRVEEAAGKGWPLGSGAFLAELALKSARPVVARRRGRPRKVQDEAR